uniref:Uncharacterized protein n=1 Tax=Micrurus spixii TaxID=129469 RepID=A0A2D4M045_9SAUR
MQFPSNLIPGKILSPRLSRATSEQSCNSCDKGSIMPSTCKHVSVGTQMFLLACMFCLIHGACAAFSFPFQDQSIQRAQLATFFNYKIVWISPTFTTKKRRLKKPAIKCVANKR